MDWNAFFRLHADLPREGPGEAEDVAWAASQANLPDGAAICDAACGPGADIAALLECAPGARVHGVEKHSPFVAQARAVWSDDPRVTITEGDMRALTGPYDMIWCAGALYFLGVTNGLTVWRPALAPGGMVAFSEPCWFTDQRSPKAVENWAEYPPMTDETGIAAWVEEAGFEVLATRRLSDAAREAYYTPMDERIARLRPNADPALQEVLDMATSEAEVWRRHSDQFGYLLVVARPRA